MKDYSKELTSEQKLVKVFIDTLNKRIEKLLIDNKKLKEQLTLPDVVSSCVDRKTLIEDLDDKRIIGTLVDKDGWYYCRKETAQHLLDKYEIKHK